MKVMFVLFATWKGAKITTEYSMHVLRAYHVSLASLWPNQVSCLTSGNRFGMQFLYLQFTLEWINIFYFRVTCIVHMRYTFFLIILLIWLFASVGSLQIGWESYRNYLGSLPAYCTAGQHIWRSIMPPIHFWVVEGHHPERVLRQFGMKQGIPVDVDTSTELHKITLQGK